jgi:ABC-2 type transport system permease protein
MSLFLFQLYYELKKMFARKRTYIGFGAFLAMEALVLFSLSQPRRRAYFQHIIEQNGFSFDRYFSGLTLGFFMVFFTLLPQIIFIALVAGDITAKEVEEGTLRMMLCRSISRGRIILLKYISCVIYTFVFIFFIGVTALIAGILFRGVGGLFVFDQFEGIFSVYDTYPGLVRFFCALPLLALSLTTVASIGFMFSCFNMKPASATVVTLAVILLDFIFRHSPVFESLHPYFITTHISAWLQVFVTPVHKWNVIEDYTYLLALDATCLVIALAAFQRRDFKA